MAVGPGVGPIGAVARVGGSGRCAGVVGVAVGGAGGVTVGAGTVAVAATVAGRTTMSMPHRSRAEGSASSMTTGSGAPSPSTSKMPRHTAPAVPDHAADTR